MPTTTAVPILNSTSDTNFSIENLTVYYTVANSDNNASVVDWRDPTNSLAVINMPFEGGSNSTFTNDVSTYGNDGAVGGPVWGASAGYDGLGGYVYDGGATDKITITDAGGLDCLTGCAISVWVNTNTFDENQGVVGRLVNGYFLALYKTGTGGDRGEKITWGKRGSAEVVSAAALNTGQWYNIVAATGSGNYTIYVDGVWSATTAGAAPANLGTDIAIGNIPDDNWGFNGTIDNVRFYNYTLSAEQIMAIYINKTDTIVNQELSEREVYQACVTSFNSTVEGDTNCSSSLTIDWDDCFWQSGNWGINASHSCNLITSYNLISNNLSITQTGTVTMSSSITNLTKVSITGNTLRINGGTLRTGQ